MCAVCTGACQSQRKWTNILKLELHTAVNYRVGARNRIQVLCKSRGLPLPLSHLFSPLLGILSMGFSCEFKSHGIFNVRVSRAGSIVSWRSYNRLDCLSLVTVGTECSPHWSRLHLPSSRAQCTDWFRIHRQPLRPSLVDGQGSGTGFLPVEPATGRDLEGYAEVLGISSPCLNLPPYTLV